MLTAKLRRVRSDPQKVHRKKLPRDGDSFLLTSTSAGKLADNHYSNGTTMDDEDFYVKANAAVHIDELIKISENEGKPAKPDAGGRHGALASKGWEYRPVFFEDFNGTYYKMNISIPEGQSGKTVYNLGNIKERTPTKINGSSVEDGAQKGESSPKGMVAQSEDSVNTKKQNGRAAISNEEYWEMNELNEERDAIRQEIHEKESRSLSRPA